MLYSLTGNPDRWADLLNSYANKGERTLEKGEGEIVCIDQKRKIKIDNHYINDHTIIEISREIVEKSLPLSLPLLKKLKQAFDHVVEAKQALEATFKSNLKTFYVRVSKWAQNHTT